MKDQLIKFRDYLYLIGAESMTEEALELLYDEPITITFNGHTVVVPFDAVAYNGLVDLIEAVLEEY